ncbi:MAG: hypothetical protein AAB065_02665 [Deltaproteobacteria bacterium]
MTIENEEKENEEIRLLLQCVTANLESFKNRQWHVFVFYSSIAAFLITQADDMETITKICISVVLLIGLVSAIWMLKHYQQKMSVERKVQDNIYKHFGRKFHECREPRDEEGVKKSDVFERCFVGCGGYAYLIAVFTFVMVTFWCKHI